MMIEGWPSVADAGPTLSHHWVNVYVFAGKPRLTLSLTLFMFVVNQLIHVH